MPRRSWPVPSFVPELVDGAQLTMDADRRLGSRRHVQVGALHVEQALEQLVDVPHCRAAARGPGTAVLSRIVDRFGPAVAVVGGLDGPPQGVDLGDDSQDRAAHERPHMSEL